MKFLSEMLDQSELDADDSELSNTTKLTYTLPHCKVSHQDLGTNE